MGLDRSLTLLLFAFLNIPGISRSCKIGYPVQCTSLSSGRATVKKKNQFADRFRPERYYVSRSISLIERIEMFGLKLGGHKSNWLVQRNREKSQPIV